LRPITPADDTIGMDSDDSFGYGVVSPTRDLIYGVPHMLPEALESANARGKTLLNCAVGDFRFETATRWALALNRLRTDMGWQIEMYSDYKTSVFTLKSNTEKLWETTMMWAPSIGSEGNIHEFTRIYGKGTGELSLVAMRYSESGGYYSVQVDDEDYDIPDKLAPPSPDTAFIRVIMLDITGKGQQAAALIVA
jgi:hypothetical protein